MKPLPMLLSALLFAALAMAADKAPDPVVFARQQAQIRELLSRLDFGPAAEQASALNRSWPDDIPTYQLLAAAHLGLGNYAEADRALQWMLDLRLGKADLAGYWLLARFREVTGDADGAIEAMNLAFGRLQTGEAGDRAGMLAYLAQLHIVAGKRPLAARILKEADASHTDVLIARATLLEQKPAEAAEAWRQVIARQPHARHRYALAEATADAADDQAFERAARSVTDAPDNANRELVLYLAGRGRQPAEALALARREAARRHDVLTQTALAVALAANQKKDEAQKVMREVLAVGTLDPRILAQAAQLGIKPE